MDGRYYYRRGTITQQYRSEQEQHKLFSIIE
jgi:hypothetical protein